MSSTDDIDVPALLVKRKQIAAIWSVEDVQELRPDLTAEQAWQVLQCVDSRQDSNVGITWATLEDAAEDLFGPEADDEA